MRDLRKLLMGAPGPWSLPATASEEDRLAVALASAEETEPPAVGLVCIVAQDREAALALADVLSAASIPSTWRADSPQAASGVAATIVDLARGDDFEWRTLAETCASADAGPVLALLGFPRPADADRAGPARRHEAALEAAAAADLRAEIQRAIAASSARLRKRHAESVVGQFDARRELRLGRVVLEFVRHVGKERPLRAYPLGDGDGFGQAEVSGVRPRPQGVEHEHIEPGQQRPGFVGDEVAVGAISHLAHAKAQHLRPAMRQPKRDDGDAQQVETIRRDPSQVEQRYSAAVMRRVALEGIVERTTNAGFDLGLAVDRQGVPQVVGKQPQIVEAEDMVGMTVGIEDSLQSADLGSQELGAQIGRSVDQQHPARQAQRDGATEPLIVGVGASAGRAGAADHRDAHRSAGSQKLEVSGQAWGDMEHGLRHSFRQGFGPKNEEEHARAGDLSARTRFVARAPSDSSLPQSGRESKLLAY